MATVTPAAPTTLLEATRFFADPDVCLAAAIQLRWGAEPVSCPTCGSTDVHFIQTRRIWRCSNQHPRRQFSVKIGTVMEDSPLPLDKWMVAIWLLANAKNGISSYELGRAIGITQKSAWFMLHRVRLAMQTEGGKLNGVIEADETYIGGASRFMHKSKRERINVKRGRSIAGKTAVMGLLARHGKDGHSVIRTEVLSSLRKPTVQGYIKKHVETGSTVNTDKYRSYDHLGAESYEHKVIDHAEKYVDGQVYTNGCENFWSLLKRAIKGTYVAVEPFHLFRYLDEQCFRFNNRKLTDAQRFAYAASTIVGKRLTYKALIGKDLLESRAN